MIIFQISSDVTHGIATSAISTEFGKSVVLLFVFIHLLIFFWVVLNPKSTQPDTTQSDKIRPKFKEISCETFFFLLGITKSKSIQILFVRIEKLHIYTCTTRLVRVRLGVRPLSLQTAVRRRRILSPSQTYR